MTRRLIVTRASDIPTKAVPVSVLNHVLSTLIAQGFDWDQYGMYPEQAYTWVCDSDRMFGRKPLNRSLFFQAWFTLESYGVLIPVDRAEGKRWVLNNDAIPTLFARREGDLLIVDCPHCQIEHVHGLSDGHVVADCVDPASPYRRTGYYVRETA